MEVTAATRKLLNAGVRAATRTSEPAKEYAVFTTPAARPCRRPGSERDMSMTID